MSNNEGFVSVLVNEVKNNARFYQGLGFGALTAIGAAAAAARYFISSNNNRMQYTNRTPVTIADIRLYPVKGCAGVQVQSLSLANRGDLYDRQYIIICDRQKVDGTVKYITGRCTPKICLIRPKINDEEGGALTLCFQGHSDVTIPRSVANAQWYDLKPVKQRCVGQDCGEDVARWLQRVLDLPDLRLVRMHPFNKLTTHNESDTNRERSTFGDLVSQFQDSYPFSVVSQGTVDHTAKDCNMSVEEVIMRFRPNIIVDAMEPYVEDSWISLDSVEGAKNISNAESTSTIDTVVNISDEERSALDTDYNDRFSMKKNVMLKTFKPCPRCSVPGVNPYTADRKFNPDSVISKYRSGTFLMQTDTLWYQVYKKHRNNSFWSVLMVAHHDPSARICVGDGYLAQSKHAQDF